MMFEMRGRKPRFDAIQKPLRRPSGGFCVVRRHRCAICTIFGSDPLIRGKSRGAVPW
jgi:hypothetical protein